METSLKASQDRLCDALSVEDFELFEVVLWVSFEIIARGETSQGLRVLSPWPDDHHSWKSIWALINDGVSLPVKNSPSRRQTEQFVPCVTDVTILRLVGLLLDLLKSVPNIFQ